MPAPASHVNGDISRLPIGDCNSDGGHCCEQQNCCHGEPEDGEQSASLIPPAIARLNVADMTSEEPCISTSVSAVQSVPYDYGGGCGEGRLIVTAVVVKNDLDLGHGEPCVDRPDRVAAPDMLLAGPQAGQTGCDVPSESSQNGDTCIGVTGVERQEGKICGMLEGPACGTVSMCLVLSLVVCVCPTLTHYRQYVVSC